jgi:hypothetical protein
MIGKLIYNNNFFGCIFILDFILISFFFLSLMKFFVSFSVVCLVLAFVFCGVLQENLIQKRKQRSFFCINICNLELCLVFIVGLIKENENTK